MSQYPDTRHPRWRPPSLKLWKQLKPLYVDTISRLESCGTIRSPNIPLNVKVKLHIQSFHRLSVAKNISSGRTTSRLACPPGDGRGVPKCFQDFGKFSKLPIRADQTYKHSQPLLAGSALRRRLSLSVFRSYNKDRSVSISLVRKGDHSVLAVILADLNKMDPLNPTSALSLMDLIADTDFDMSAFDNITEPVFPEISSQELDFFLQPPAVLSPQSSPLEDCPLPPHIPFLDLTQTFPAEVIIPAGPNQTILNLRQTGPNTFEVTELPLGVDPESPLALGSVSPPSSPATSTSSQYSSEHPSTSTKYFPSSSSSHSVSPPSSPPSSSFATFYISPEETKEEKRLREQKEVCRRYRANKKRKREEENQELEELERRKRELEMKVEVMEEMVAGMRETVMERVTGRRKREEGSEEREKKVRRT